MQKFMSQNNINHLIESEEHSQDEEDRLESREMWSKKCKPHSRIYTAPTFQQPATINISKAKKRIVNDIIKNTIMNQNKPLEKVNMLFSMAQGKSADHFISSKSYTEVNHKAHSTYNAHQAFTLGLVDIFDVAAFQKSENYRAPAKKIINLNPIKIPEKKKKVNEKKLKRKTGLSTLAIIREESKIANSKKLKNASKHATIKKQSSMSIPALHKFSLKTNI